MLPEIAVVYRGAARVRIAVVYRDAARLALELVLGLNKGGLEKSVSGTKSSLTLAQHPHGKHPHGICARADARPHNEDSNIVRGIKRASRSRNHPHGKNPHGICARADARPHNEDLSSKTCR